MRTEDFRVDKEQDAGNKCHYPRLISSREIFLSQVSWQIDRQVGTYVDRQMNETVDNLTDRPSDRPVFWQINKTNRQVHGQLNIYIDPTVDVQTDTKCQT